MSEDNDDDPSEYGKLLRRAGEEAMGTKYAVCQGALSAYKLESLIAKGGGGAHVCLARNEDGLSVALKLLPTNFLDSKEVTERFSREARLMFRISHPNVVSILDNGESPDGHPFIVMDYVSEGSIAYQISKGTRFSPEEAIRIVAETCLGLEKLHEENVIHRDIKPGNILLTSEHQPKLCDFGLAKHLHPDGLDLSSLTGSSKLGTYGFLAPEQTVQRAEVDHRADLFSLGAVLHYLLTGIIPGGSIFTPLATVRPELASLDGILSKVLANDPNQRYQSAAEFREALLGANISSRRRRILIGGAAILGLAATTSLWLKGRDREDFWEVVGKTQSYVEVPGRYVISLSVNSHPVRFAIAWSQSPWSYRIDPINLPTSFRSPLPNSAVIALIEEGLDPGFIARLTLNAIQVTLPDRPNEPMTFANLPHDVTRVDACHRFLYGCEILTFLHERRLLDAADGFRLNSVESYAAFCKRLAVPRIQINDLFSSENQSRRLVRIALYESLRGHESHPAFAELGATSWGAVKMRSLLDILGSLVAEKVMVRALPSAGRLVEQIDPLFDAASSPEATKRQIETSIDLLLHHL